MLKSLVAVLGLGIFGLATLFVFSSDQPSSYNSIARRQFNMPSKQNVLIYGATKYFGSPMFNDDYVKQSCSEETASYCSYTNNPNESRKADAWLYHNRDFTAKLMENRSNDQIHVMFTQESPIHETIRFKPNTINWTMSFRRNSDIFWPYSYMEMKVFQNKLNNDSIWTMKDPTKTAAWLVSNCNAGNKRKEIVEKVKKFRLKVDIYGACGPLKIPSCGRYDNKRDECAAEVLTKYYFYFAFENSNCVDYVTEKFFNALKLFYAVPIVIKREIYTKLGFPGKSFIALDDFSSIEEMVGFLENLKQNKTEYLSYHDWRNDWEVRSGGDDLGICALCNKLRGPILRQKSYSNLERWFSRSTCDNDYALKYL